MVYLNCDVITNFITHGTTSSIVPIKLTAFGVKESITKGSNRAASAIAGSLPYSVKFQSEIKPHQVMIIQEINKM